MGGKEMCKEVGKGREVPSGDWGIGGRQGGEEGDYHLGIGGWG